MEKADKNNMLIKYIDDELAGDELKKFELELKSNSSLRSDLEILEILKSTIQNKRINQVNQNLIEFANFSMHPDYKKYIKPAFIDGKINGKEQKLAQKKLYNDHLKSIVKLLISKGVNNQEDAKDIFNQAFMILAKNVIDDNFELSSSLKSYLWGIAWRIWFKSISKDNTDELKKEYPDKWNENRFLSEIDPTIRSIDIWKIVQKILNNLGEPCRGLLKYWAEGKTFKEILKIMPVLKTEANARQKKGRCLEKFIKIVKDDPDYPLGKDKFNDLDNLFEEVVQVLKSNNQNDRLEQISQNLNEFSKQQSLTHSIQYETQPKKKIEVDDKKPKSASIPFYKQNWFKIAAAVVMIPLASFIILKFTYTPDYVIADNLVKPQSETTKSPSDKVLKHEELINNGYELLKNNQAEEALEKFKKVNDKDIGTDTKFEVSRYIALCHIKNGDYTAAKKELEMIIKSDEFGSTTQEKASSLLRSVKILDFVN